jgi:nucleolar protein 6
VPAAKSKGCAFLEFTAKAALQQALKLHHSELDGREINVELTAGGGGKSEGRLAKLQKRNKELNAQRVCSRQLPTTLSRDIISQTNRLKKTGADGGDGTSRPQRFSTTSGEGDAPKAERTWTVGDTIDKETHRGGEKAKKRGKKRPNMGTGVNAIPVG